MEGPQSDQEVLIKTKKGNEKTFLKSIWKSFIDLTKAIRFFDFDSDRNESKNRKNDFDSGLIQINRP